MSSHVLQCWRAGDGGVSGFDCRSVDRIDGDDRRGAVRGKKYRGARFAAVERGCIERVSVRVDYVQLRYFGRCGRSECDVRCDLTGRPQTGDGRRFEHCRAGRVEPHTRIERNAAAARGDSK